MENILLILRHTKKQLKNDIKYNGIINAFKRKGYCVWFTYSDDEIIYIDNGEKKIKIGKVSSKFQNISRNTSLYRAVFKFIKSTDTIFKYCYIRSVPALPGYVKMLKAIKKAGLKIAVEIPTYPATGEQKTERKLRKYFLSLINGYDELSWKYIDLYLPMGELTDKINGVPAVNIENGIDVSLLSERNYTPVKNGEVHIVAVAKFARWHGYDRLIDGMKQYCEKKDKTKVVVHLIGPDGDGTLKRYEEQIKRDGLEEVVLLEGPKYGTDANKYFDMADVAVASLGRNDIKRISSLKIGEYMARGIPFIYGRSECQVRDEWDFCISVPAEDSPVDIEEIVKFAIEVNKCNDISDTMRTIARKELSWDEQINRIIDYFE